MSSSSSKAPRGGVSIAVTPASTGQMTFTRQFLIDLAIASALLGMLILYAVSDQLPQPTTFEFMSYHISP